jgi:hypothetical protein
VPVRRSLDEVQTQSAERMMWESTPTVPVPHAEACGHPGFLTPTVQAFDSDTNRSADFVCGHSWFERSPLRRLPLALGKSAVTRAYTRVRGALAGHQRRHTIKVISGLDAPSARPAQMSLR